MNTAHERIDTDFDGIPDTAERFLGTDLLRNDAPEDLDGDGASNIEEYAAGTDPTYSEHWAASVGNSVVFGVNTRAVVRDSDQDGLPDWWEASYFSPGIPNGSGDDPDRDGIPNSDEYQAGTNPVQAENYATTSSASELFALLTRVHGFGFSRDQDGDGLPDWWELRYGLSPSIPDSQTDLDLDGIPAMDEFLAGLNPTLDDALSGTMAFSGTFSIRTILARLDSDMDGLPDAWEAAIGLNPGLADSLSDPDEDGLSNLQEYNSGTSPFQADDHRKSETATDYFSLDTGGLKVSYWQDTDLEGMPDWWELRYGLNHRLNDALGDRDADGVGNLIEFRFGSNPNVYDWQRPEDLESKIFAVNTGGGRSDTDSDGLPDDWERLYFGDLRPDGSEDADGDGLKNRDEYLAGTNPSLASSTLRGSVSLTGSQITLRWQSVAGRRYRVLSRANVGDANPAVEEELTAASDHLQVSIPLSGRQLYFIIEVH